MKKNIVLILLIAIFIVGQIPFTMAVEFSDLTNDHWAYKTIIKLADNGVINGYPEGTYCPENPVTRGEFLKLILTASVGNDYFKDNKVADGEHWAINYAKYAEDNELLMLGTSTDNLDADISRLEMAVILARVAMKDGIEDYEYGVKTSFSDTENLPNGGSIYIKYIASLGLVNGYPDGTFGPDKTMTRAEVATVIDRFLSKKS